MKEIHKLDVSSFRIAGPQLSESRGCLSSKASNGEAVVSYCEPLATQEMGYHRLSQRVNKMKLY